MAPGELGRVIGRQGRTAAAVRTLAAAAGELDGAARRRSISATSSGARTDGPGTSMVTVGRIVRPHGNRGRGRRGARDGLRRERFRAGRDAAVGAATAMPAPLTRRRRAASIDGRWVVGFDGVDDDERRRGAARPGAADAGRGAAAAGAGRVLRARPGRVPGRDRRRRGRSGASSACDSASGAPLLVVDGAQAAKCWCRWSTRSAGAWTSAAKRIVIDPPDGLIELNRRKAEPMMVDIITIFPRDGRGGAGGRRRRPGARARAGRHPGAGPARLHRRPAPDGRRRAVRRRAGDGDEARAAVPRGRGDRAPSGARRRRSC